MSITETDKVITKFSKYNIGKISQDSIRTQVLGTKQLFKYLNKTIFEVTPDDVNMWIKWLFLNNFSKGEIRKRVCAAQTFFSWCLIQKILIDNPCADIPHFRILYKKYLDGRDEYSEQ